MKLIVERGERADEVMVEREGDHWLIRVGEADYRVDAATVAGSARSLRLDGRQFEVDVEHLGDGRYEIGHGGHVEEVVVRDPLAYLADRAHATSRARGPETVAAYMPGKVVAILVEEGAEVTAGDGILVLEAMKMENEIQAERDGVISRLLVELGAAVEGGDPLFEIA